ncbi:MAG TPA: hypothetical protein VGN63_24570 [Flavisolibacter sp.]|jgi:hypothetical protein|nr:hypothetical protein [Flavisolibacter sp.]
MKKAFTPTLLLMLVITACTNANPKEMAAELCDCIQLKKQVSTKAKEIILKAAESNAFEETLQEELAAIEDEAEMEEVGDDIQNIALAFQGENVKECAARVDKKHRISKRDEKEMQTRLVEEMNKLDDCTVYAAFIKVGLQQQEKGETMVEETASEEASKKVAAKDE